jgi:hypothetical protein
MPGFAAFHIGIQTDETPSTAAPDDMLSQEPSDDVDSIDGMSEEEE